MKTRVQQWRLVRHPLRISEHGWQWGRRSLVSPRGTIFEMRWQHRAWWGRKRLDFQLEN
jgi:hypothetical protein